MVSSSLVTAILVTTSIFIYGYYQGWKLPIIGSRIQETDKEKSNDTQTETPTLVEEPKVEEPVVVPTTSPSTQPTTPPVVSEFKTYSNKDFGISFQYKYNTYSVKQEGNQVLVTTYLYDKYKNGAKKLSNILVIEKGTKPTEMYYPAEQSVWPKSIKVLGKNINQDWEIQGGGGGGSTASVQTAYGQINSKIYSILDYKVEITTSFDGVGDNMEYRPTDQNVKDAVKILESIKNI